MPYMRIESNKFWGWVVVSLLVGLAIGLVIMLARTSSLNGQITVLQNRVNGASANASEALASVQAQLASDEASITALTDQNVNLATQLAAAQAQVKTLKKTSSSSTSTSTVTVVSRSVSPSTVATSGSITMTVKVTGHPSSVTMRVYTSSKSFDTTYSLHRITRSGNNETWRATVKAPKKSGTYRYYATATKGSTKVTIPGASPKTFKVK